MKARQVLGLLSAGLLVAAAGLSGCGSPAPAGPSAGPEANGTAAPASPTLPGLVVTAAHVNANLARSVVIDARSAEDYAAGHIPGAVNASWRLFSRVDSGEPGDKRWGTLDSPAKIASALGRLGVDGKKQIVVYTANGSSGEDGRIVWMLRMAGLSNSVVVDGGYKAWTDAGLPTTTEAPAPTATKLSIKSLDQDLRATTDDVVAGLGTLKIVDARSSKEFAGAVYSGEARGGHVPGAVNAPFASLFTESGRLKNPAELAAVFETAKLSLLDDVVVYSTDGVSSAYMTLVMRELGFRSVRNYDGSFYEWAGDSDLKVEK